MEKYPTLNQIISSRLIVNFEKEYGAKETLRIEKLLKRADKKLETKSFSRKKADEIILAGDFYFPIDLVKDFITYIEWYIPEVLQKDFTVKKVIKNTKPTKFIRKK